MKHDSLVHHALSRALMLAALVALVVAGALSGLISSRSTSAVVRAGFVSRSGAGMQLNGQPYHFAGFNLYQANSVRNCSYTMGTGSSLDQSLTDIGTGSNYAFRAWFFQSLGTVNGQLNWTVFDHTLQVAAAHGYKVIPTLTNQWGSCENQPSSLYKPLGWYQGGYNQPDGTTPLSYRDFVQQIVTRYKDNPAILSWQLVNEAEAADSHGGACQESAAATALRAFTDDIGGLVKSIDPSHLVNLGSMGSGQCGLAGSDYQHVNDSPSNDWCEFHDYGHFTTPMPPKLLADIAACNAIGRPIFVGETGVIDSNYSTRASELDAKFSAQYGAGVVGELVWNWDLNGSRTTSYNVGPGDPTIAVISKYEGSTPAGGGAPSPTPTTRPKPSPPPPPSPIGSPSPTPSGPPSPGASNCPEEWTCADLGRPALAGSQSYNATTGAWTVNAAGYDIGFQRDSFRFVWQAHSGDGSVSAHVMSQANTSITAKAGVMFRATTDPASPEYSIMVTPGTGIKVQVRATQGGTTTKIANPTGTAPEYVRVARAGNTFTAYTSTDGRTWTLVPESTYTLAAPDLMLEGLAVTSHNTSASCTVTADSVTAG